MSKSQIYFELCRKFLFLLLFLAAACVLFSPDSYAKTKNRASSYNPRFASIVIDADTGRVVEQHSADKALHPASLTKIMTLALVFEALDDNRLSMNDRVVFSRHAASMEPSKLGIAPGQSITVRDAIYAVVTKSANDVAVALAEKVGKSESSFALMMNRKAREIGMSNSHFVNASGLHNGSQVSSARDMARLARYIIKTYPHYYHVFSTKSFTFRGSTFANHNKLMNSYPGMDGLKTGFVQASGFNLVASAKRNNHRLIGVVFGGTSWASRNQKMASLLDAGFLEIGAGNYNTAGLGAPLPKRKPYRPTMEASLNKDISPAAGTMDIREQKPEAETSLLAETDAAANTVEEAQHKTNILEAAFTEEIGEKIGDALAKHLYEKEEKPAKLVLASLDKEAGSQKTYGRWSVQIGSYSSKVETDRILNAALKRLPEDLSKGSPIIAPHRNGERLIFKARLEGYSRSEALRACEYLGRCTPLAPGVY